MEREGVPLHYLQPSNVKVTAARIAGDGVRQNAIAEANFLLTNINMYPPEAQQTIKRRATASVTDDYELAEQLIPITEIKDNAQTLTIMTENNTFITSGEALMFSGKAMPVNDADIHPTHIQAHFNLMGWLIQKGAQQQSSFTPEQDATFKACGSHTIAHINVIAQMGDKESAKRYMDEMNNIAAMGQKMSNNLAQKQQGQEQDIDPIDMAKVQLDARKVDLQEMKFQHGAMKFERQQSHRESEAAMNNVIKLEKDRRDDKMTKQELAIRDIETAQGIRDRNKPEKTE
jgi:hypothetical protein